MVLSGVGEFRELGEGTSYCPVSVVSEKSIRKPCCVYVGLVHTYAYIKIHKVTRLDGMNDR